MVAIMEPAAGLYFTKRSKQIVLTEWVLDIYLPLTPFIIKKFNSAMYKIIPVALVILLTLNACQSTEEENSELNTANTTAAPVVSPPPPAPVKPAAVISTPSPAAPIAAQGVLLNPPHGQPGHSCDIEVGKPLPQGGTKTTMVQTPPPVPVQNQLPVMQNPQPMKIAPQGNPNVLPNTTKGAVNPPHGQPGHRCEIAVGAPLN